MVMQVITLVILIKAAFCQNMIIDHLKKILYLSIMGIRILLVRPFKHFRFVSQVQAITTAFVAE